MPQNINILIPDQSELALVSELVGSVVASGRVPTQEEIAKEILNHKETASENLIKGAEKVIAEQQAAAAISQNISSISYSGDELTSTPNVPFALPKADLSRDS
jgi:hypothetical protein